MTDLWQVVVDAYCDLACPSCGSVMVKEWYGEIMVYTCGWTQCDVHGTRYKAHLPQVRLTELPDSLEPHAEDCQCAGCSWRAVRYAKEAE